jgi:hypothetical protein
MDIEKLFFALACGLAFIAGTFIGEALIKWNVVIKQD